MSSAETTILLPAATGQEAWRTGGKASQATLLDTNRVKDPEWIAVPMRSIISLPMRFPAMSADRQKAAAALELEGVGLHHVLENEVEVQSYDDGHKDQRAWTAVLAGSVPQAEELGIDSRFAPSVAFKKLRPGQITLWHEQDRLAVAIPDQTGHPLHAQALTARDTDEDAAAELRCILAALDLSGMDASVDRIVSQKRAEEPPELLLEDFSHSLKLPVSVETLVPPQPPVGKWSLVPMVVTQQRKARQQRQTMLLVSLGAVLVITAMLAAYAARLWTRERTAITESKKLENLQPTLQIIRETQERWQVLEKALLSKRYVVEMFASVADKLPAEGIRMTNFQISNGGNVTIDAEASNQALAGQLREDLNLMKCFEGMDIQVPPFGMDPAGRATFHADILNPSVEEAAPTP
jgi:hypothetical protein